MAVDSTIQVNDPRTGQGRRMGLFIIDTVGGDSVYGLATVAESSATSGTARTPGLLRTTTTGTVAAGARSVAVANTGAASGTLLGATLKAGESVSYSASDGDTLAALAYVATGTEFVISEVR